MTPSPAVTQAVTTAVCAADPTTIGDGLVALAYAGAVSIGLWAYFKFLRGK